MPADLGSLSGRDELAARIEAAGLDVEILVNNAGFGDSGDFHKTDRERNLRMIELNCGALTDLQGRYLPPMVERGSGCVINIASMAAFQPIPSNAVYAATKAFVLSLTEAVHAELEHKGVTVTAVCPGPVKTEFVAEASMEGAEDRTPDFVWTTPTRSPRRPWRAPRRASESSCPACSSAPPPLGGQHAPRAVLLPLAQPRLALGVCS